MQASELQPGDQFLDAADEMVYTIVSVEPPQARVSVYVQWAIDGAFTTREIPNDQELNILRPAPPEDPGA